MLSNTNKTFAILFSVNFQNKNGGKRLVIMRQFLENGLGKGIKILDQAMFPDYARYGFIILAETDDVKLIEAAVDFCKGIFTVEIEEVSSITFNPEVKESDYCLFTISSDSKQDKPILKSPEHSSSEVSIRFEISFAKDKLCSNICMVHAESYGLAHSYRASTGSYITEVARTMSLKAFFETKINADSRPKAETESIKTPLSSRSPNPNFFSIYNEGMASVQYMESPEHQTLPFGYASQRKNAAPNVEIRGLSNPYIWRNIKGSIVLVAKYGSTNDFNHVVPFSMSSDWTFPDLSIPKSLGAIAGFNLEKGKSFHVRSELYLWLDALMNTDSYHANWPEDDYVDGHLAAYNYIISKIPGGVPPKKGTIKEPHIIKEIDFPDNGNFTSREFNDVKGHLLVEIDHFITADKWFGSGGIIDNIFTNIAIVSTNDLIEASELMSIEKKDPVKLLLDEIFGVLTSFLAIFPPIGSSVSAVIKTGWNTAKIIMGNQAPVRIETTVGQMAEDINKHLESMIADASAQLKILYSDWGKLEEFSNGVIKGIIGPDNFSPAGYPLDAHGLPKGYLQAAANAYLVIAFQHLFAVKHSVESTVSTSPTLPKNPWNPEAGNYNFTWFLKCKYKPGKKSEYVPGYLVFDCKTTAPKEVMQRIFGPGKNNLNINPFDFFMGINNWPHTHPVWNAGYHVSDKLPDFNVIDIGL